MVKMNFVFKVFLGCTFLYSTVFAQTTKKIKTIIVDA